MLLSLSNVKKIFGKFLLLYFSKCYYDSNICSWLKKNNFRHPHSEVWKGKCNSLSPYLIPSAPMAPYGVPVSLPRFLGIDIELSSLHCLPSAIPVCLLISVCQENYS